LLIGYFEGIDGERGIAWRLADSLALRKFVGIGLEEYTPDHSTKSPTRRLIDLDTHREVFGWVLSLLADRGLLKGKRIAIDATTLEANAAMRSIERRDTGQSYEEFLVGLAKASGIETPTGEELARFDRKRKKRMSNQEWKSPSDDDARITKMKDGRTHLAHKAEHAVDLDTGAVVAVTLQGADLGDTTTLDQTLSEAGMAVADLVEREAELRPEERKNSRRSTSRGSKRW
jgi:transposase